MDLKLYFIEDDMKGYCAVCGKEIEVQMCCSGDGCGCFGLPIDPPVCNSDKCWEEWEQRNIEDIEEELEENE